MPSRINDLREEYNRSIADEFERMSTKMNSIESQLSQLNLTLATLNLVELRADVMRNKEMLLKYDLEKMHAKVERHDGYIKYGFGVLATLQLVLTIVFAFKEYIFGKPGTGMVVPTILQLIG
jgi:hypothetical protein